MPWEQLLGPLGFLAGSLIAIGVLWRLVGDYIAELKARAARSERLVDGYEDKFDEVTDALKVLPTILLALDRIERQRERT